MIDKAATFKPVKNVPSAGISTKQRLSQTALAAVKPKSVSALESGSTKKMKPLPGRANNQSLMNLSFKKGPQPVVIPNSNHAGSSNLSPLKYPGAVRTPSQSPVSQQMRVTPPADLMFDAETISASPLNLSPSAAHIDSSNHSVAATLNELFDMPMSEVSSPPCATMLVHLFLTLFSFLTSRRCSNPIEMLSEADKFLQEIMPERYIYHLVMIDILNKYI